MAEEPAWPYGTVSVVSTHILNDKSGQYCAYKVEVSQNGRSYELFRRMTDFRALYELLTQCKKLNKAAVEALHFPNKEVKQRNRLDPAFRERRSLIFQEFLRDVVALRSAQPSSYIADFLNGDWNGFDPEYKVDPNPSGEVPNPGAQPLALIGLFPAQFRDVRYLVPTEGCTIGSNNRSLITIQDEQAAVSRTHCRIMYSKSHGKYFIADLGSSNHTVLTHAAVCTELPPNEFFELHTGDVIQVGPTIQLVVQAPDIQPVEEEERQEGLMRGILFKSGLKKLFGRWDERFCVLTSESLSYFHPQDPVKPRGSISLAIVAAVTPSGHSKAPLDKGAFDVVTEARVYTFYARTAEESKEWMEAIREASSGVSKRKMSTTEVEDARKDEE